MALVVGCRSVVVCICLLPGHIPTSPFGGSNYMLTEKALALAEEFFFGLDQGEQELCHFTKACSGGVTSCSSYILIWGQFQMPAVLIGLPMNLVAVVQR